MPLIASRAADSAFALGFGKASSSSYTSWFPSLVYGSAVGSDSCIDSLNNSYVTINFGVRTIVQKIDVTGTVIWEKIVGTTGFDVVKSFIALSTDEATVYLAQNTGRVNGANWCVELNAINTSNGSLSTTGYVYAMTGRLSNLSSFRYNSNATDGKKLSFVLTGYQARSYPTMYSTSAFFVDPTNFASYRQSVVLGVNFTPSGYMTGSSAVTLAGGTTFMVVNSSANGYGIIGIDTSGNVTGSIKLQATGDSIATNASGYAYYNFSTGNAQIGIGKVSSAFGFQWANEISLTDATGRYGTSENKNVYVDSAGNVYCVTTFGNSSINKFIVVFKMNSSGVVQWVKKIVSTYSQPTGGGLYADSISGNADFLTISGKFTEANSYAFGLTLKTNGSNIDGTYTGNSSTGNMIISTPTYTVNYYSNAGSFGYIYDPSTSIDVAQTTNASSSTISVGVTPVLLPYS